MNIYLNNTNKQSYIRNKFELDSFQSKTFDYIDDKKHVVVSAPTGSGKTIIADYAIESVKSSNPFAKIIYTCPIKALCNEKYRDMVLSWGSEPYNYTIGLMTGDFIINPYGDNGLINPIDPTNLTDLTDPNDLTDLTDPTDPTDPTNSEYKNKLDNGAYGEIVVMTTEVLQKLLESNNSSKKKINPDVIIFDEAHYIDDDSRGHVWEKCIIGSLLETNALLVLLSATIGNIPELTTWLNSIAPGKIFESVIKTERPVPLRQFVIDNTKSRVFKKITADADQEIRKVSSDPDPESYELIELTGTNYDRVKKYWDKLEQYGYSEKFELETLCNQISSNPDLGIPAIIFCFSKKQCESNALSIENSSFVKPEDRDEILRFYDSNLREFKDCLQYIQLRKVIEKGIGYHHSGLIPKIREVVEFLIKNKLIKIVFATETFAVGLNFPVKTVVFTGFVKPTERGFRFLTVSEYKQMAGRAGRRFLDPFGNVIFMFFNTKSKNKYSYPTWSKINNIVNGQVGYIQSKFIIEPNYILKNITLGTHTQMGLKSFKYYRSTTKSRDLICPDKFSKLFEIEKKIKEFANQGITFKDKNYSKLYSKLSKDEQKSYQDFLKNFNSQAVKTDLELYFDLEDSFINFLWSGGFVSKSTNTIGGWELTPKGILASEFNEINPIIFTDNIDHIMSKSHLIIPTLSMFIDDGIKIQDDEFIRWNEIEPEIVYWENTIQKYNKFINFYPKWTYWPKNFLAVREWIENEDLSLDQIAITHNIDVGLFVKILIKLYQVTDELVGKLDKLNMTDLTEKIIRQKELLIRPPLKLGSLYVNI
jgi:ATP-dependent RNA helicase DOB1